MPTSLPTAVSSDGTATLTTGYYHGIVFNIPGAEVKIDGQWMPFSQANQSLIKAKNPMTLEWRLNGDLLRKLGYEQGDTVIGQILAVDDQWNGLSLAKNFSFTIDNSNAISTLELDTSAKTWYTVDGFRLDTKPTKPGVYILNGQKVIIK